MRLAIAGKGGAGKTTISATLARLAAAAGRSVVAIDADANPNLSIALGISPSTAAELRPAPSSIVSRRIGGAGLTEPIDDVLDRYALNTPQGIRLLGMGAPAHADEGCLCSAHAVVSAILEDLESPKRFVVVDMEASPEHLSRGTVRHVDAICLVAEPYYRSLETARRMAGLVAELPIARVCVVANKVRSALDREAIEEFCDRHGLPLTGVVPWSDEVTAADRARVPVIDWPAAHPLVSAVASMLAEVERLPPRQPSSASR
ncbi:MAG: AAA family ATPase [Geodermatophilaceae bacterium]|nr:AAA family ATPase [Geodermatophilaceae bacterium]